MSHDLGGTGGKQMNSVVVREGDTLSGLALKHLGSVSRWPELYALNEAAITAEQRRYPDARRMMRGPDWIFPGMTLALPSPPPDPQVPDDRSREAIETKPGDVT